jgi:hypothetical protein
MTLRPAQVVFSLWIALFALILVNGYTLNFLGLPAHAALIFILVLTEMIILARWVLRGRTQLRIVGDPLELAGFLLVVVGTWIYFVAPSWPTLLPPSFSGDAANHLAFTNIIFSTGRIFGDYPGGPALIVATLAHWLGWLPLRVLHFTTALWMALTAGGIYGLTCTMLPDKCEHKTVALFAAFALFIPWGYFGGMLIGPQYFSPQVAAQLFLVAFVWFLAGYRESHRLVCAVGMAACLISISVSFQLWLALPLAMFGGWFLGEWRNGGLTRQAVSGTLIGLGTPALFWLAIFFAGIRFIPGLARFKASGAVLGPSLDVLGGAYLVLPALGLWLIARAGYRAWTVVAFMLLATLQTLAAIGANIWLGLSAYWVAKAFYLLVLPLALCSAIPLARVVELVQRFFHRRVLSSAMTFAAAAIGLGALLLISYPPPSFSPLNESEIRVARWAKEHLDTRHINYVGRKSIAAQWLGVALWGESFPDDLLVDLATLGPKTFEEWRDEPGWGEYLFVSSNQHFPRDPALRVVYQRGDSAIVQKPPASTRTTSTDPPARFGDTFALHDYALPSQTFRAGEVISLTAQIETLRVPVHWVAWRLQLRDPHNNAAAEARHDPFDNQFPLHRWPDGMILAQPFALPLPVDLRPGLYDLQLGLYYVGSGEPLRYETPEGAADDVMHLGQIKITLPPVTTHELGALTRTDLRIGNAFTLLGYRLQKYSPLRPGNSFKVYLYWQCLVSVPQDYTVFVHLLDASGALRAQRDTAPRNGTYPTSIWQSGEVIPDAYTLVIPHDAAPGDYRLAVGMYQWPSLQRLPVTDADGHALGDQAVLPITVQVVGQ